MNKADLIEENEEKNEECSMCIKGDVQDPPLEEENNGKASGRPTGTRVPVICMFTGTVYY